MNNIEPNFLAFTTLHSCENVAVNNLHVTADVERSSQLTDPLAFCSADDWARWATYVKCRSLVMELDPSAI